MLFIYLFIYSFIHLFIYLDKKKVQKILSFFFCELQLITFIFNLSFLYELSCVSKSICGVFHFRFHFAFIKTYIFVQQKEWTFDCMEFDFRTT